MRILFLSFRQRAADSLWLIPALGMIAAVTLALIMVEVDAGSPAFLDRVFFFDGGPDASRSLLSTIAAATLGATTLVFSVTMLVLQLASGQFSPRILRTFLRDPYAKYTLGIFVATFAYSLAVLANTDHPDSTESAPSFALSVTVGFFLVLVSVAALVTYIHHTAQSIRVVNIIGAIANDTKRTIQHLYPESAGDEADPPVAPPTGGARIEAQGSGVLTAVDHATLMKIAAEQSLVIEVVPSTGDFVAEGAVIARVHGECEDPEGTGVDISNAILLGPERTTEQDAAFGFRQLADIGARALSPGTNDPTTAVQSLDGIYALLLKLGGRHIPSPYRLDDDGALRLVLPRPDWEDYVHLALDEIMEYGVSSSQVRERLYQVLQSLEDELPAERRDAIRLHRRELDLLAKDIPIAHHHEG